MNKLLLCLFLTFLTEIGFAHPLAPSMLKIVSEGQQSEVEWKRPIEKLRGENLEAQLPQNCKRLSPSRESFNDTYLIEHYKISCPTLVGGIIEIKGLKEAQTSVVLHIEVGQGHVFQKILTPQESNAIIPGPSNALTSIYQYLVYGIEHIFMGLDHLLFILTLMILVPMAKPLLKIMTAFTLGHGLTLTLSALDLVRVNATLAEFIIALTVLYMASELTSKEKSHGHLLRRPWAIGIGFGLVHGLGFANVLKSVGLPQNQIPTALLGFNLGIEIGQVLFVLAAYFILRGFKLLGSRVPNLPAYVQRIPIFMIGITAGHWVIERLLAFQ